MAQLIEWRRRLEEARERGWFTEEDEELMNSFSTCAVGERFGGASVDKGNLDTIMSMNESRALYDLGIKAYGALELDDFQRLEEIIWKLEEMPYEMPTRPGSVTFSEAIDQARERYDEP